jgi:hypothetical protein
MPARTVTASTRSTNVSPKTAWTASQWLDKEKLLPKD